jgi:hypothetical protein
MKNFPYLSKKNLANLIDKKTEIFIRFELWQTLALTQARSVLASQTDYDTV